MFFSTNILIIFSRSILELGSSKPWPDVLEVITGQRNMDAGPLLRYFAPIHDWLKEENKKNGEYVGWETTEKGTTNNILFFNVNKIRFTVSPNSLG